jgi:hypothetical protein
VPDIVQVSATASHITKSTGNSTCVITSNEERKVRSEREREIRGLERKKNYWNEFGTNLLNFVERVVFSLFQKFHSTLQYKNE